MLHIVLVLFVATSALASSGTIDLIQIGENDRRYVDNSPLQIFFEVIDDGEVSVNDVNMKEAIKDLYRIVASPTTASGQPQAIGQALAVLGELSTGRPGDACAAANLVNAYVRYAETGNTAGVREALRFYVQNLASFIDSLSRLVSYPEASRYATGFRGGCAGEGRSYRFDEAWEFIIGSASRDQSRIIYEQYCVARRQYGAIDARNNNVGATVTASALPLTVQLYKLTVEPLRNFVIRLASKVNVVPAANAAKQALYNAVPRIIL